MKIRFKVLLILISVFFVGCKEANSVDNLEVVKPEIPESKVQIVADMVVPYDDSFQIFYTEDETLNFNEEKSVRVNIKGNTNSQKIVFDLPEDVVFSFLRFDVGENNKQSELKLNSFDIKYYNKNFEMKQGAFFQYFSGNDQIEVDSQTATIKIKENDIHDPVFYPLESLGIELSKLVK